MPLNFNPGELLPFVNHPDVKNPVRGLCRRFKCPARDAVEALLKDGIEPRRVYAWRDSYLESVKLQVCTRCGGTGYAHGGAYMHVDGGRCFKCGGQGSVPK